METQGTKATKQLKPIIMLYLPGLVCLNSLVASISWHQAGTHYDSIELTSIICKARDLDAGLRRQHKYLKDAKLISDIRFV